METHLSSNQIMCFTSDAFKMLVLYFNYFSLKKFLLTNNKAQGSNNRCIITMFNPEKPHYAQRIIKAYNFIN